MLRSIARSPSSSRTSSAIIAWSPTMWVRPIACSAPGGYAEPGALRSVRTSIMPSTSAISRWASGRAVAIAPRIQALSFGVTPGANVSVAARLSGVTVGSAVAAAPCTRTNTDSSDATTHRAMTTGA